ncbi:hypothetical protein PMIN04_002832 [Paraphaeosphaeria minitans]
MQKIRFRNIAPKPAASSPAPVAARVEMPAAPPPPPPPPPPAPTMPSLVSTQNVAPARPPPRNLSSVLQALRRPVCRPDTSPSLHYACIDLRLSAFQLYEYTWATMLWADLHPTAPTAADEDLLFERIFLSVMIRHNSTDTKVAPYTTKLTPLMRFLVRRAMTKGPYEPLGRKWTGSEVQVMEMKERYGCKCEEFGGGKTEMGSTEEMLGRELLEWASRAEADEDEDIVFFRGGRNANTHWVRCTLRKIWHTMLENRT